ncbi:hypothetical protein M0R45_036565 [Rubus argutus]|uniref:Uncharacterized protein n=1 Tax=Rubus argutus TaxID=59490 RepID=A0AAW1W1W5_RUBAR
MASMLLAHLPPSYTSPLIFCSFYFWNRSHGGIFSLWSHSYIDLFLVQAMVVGGDLWGASPLGWRISRLGSCCLLKRDFASVVSDGGIQLSCFAATVGPDLAGGGMLMGLLWTSQRGATSFVV